MLSLRAFYKRAFSDNSAMDHRLNTNRERFYVVGDIHGRADLLATMLVAIDRDMLETPAPKATEIFLGDYIDRGPASADVIEMLLPSTDNFRERVCLKGNHEQLLLQFLMEPDALDKWLAVGGAKTLASYSIKPTASISNTKVLRDAFRDALPESHRQFLQQLKTMHRAEKFAFVHAGVRPGIPLENQLDTDLLWIRRDFLDFSRDYGATIFHGHTPTPNIDVKANRIGLDTAAFQTGRLSCAVLDHTGLRFLQTHDDTVVNLSLEDALASITS